MQRVEGHTAAGLPTGNTADKTEHLDEQYEYNELDLSEK